MAIKQEASVPNLDIGAMIQEQLQSGALVMRRATLQYFGDPTGDYPPTVVLTHASFAPRRYPRKLRD